MKEAISIRKECTATSENLRIEILKPDAPDGPGDWDRNVVRLGSLDRNVVRPENLDRNGFWAATAEFQRPLEL